MLSETLYLRPHHGMCLAYFVGEGYSEGFSAHMAQILAGLTPKTTVVLTLETDAICAKCPNNSHSVCNTAEKVLRYDLAVLEQCGLEADKELAFGRFTDLVQQMILAPGRREKICGDCQWTELCNTQPSRWI